MQDRVPQEGAPQKNGKALSLDHRTTETSRLEVPYLQVQKPKPQTLNALGPKL